MKLSISNFTKFGLAASLLVLLGAGCARPAERVGDSGKAGMAPQPAPKEEVQTLDISSDVQESLTKKCFFPLTGFRDKVYRDDKKVAFTDVLPPLSENFKRATKDGEFEVICYDSIENAAYFSMATSSREYVYSFPSDNLGRDGHVLGFWKPNGPGSYRGDQVVFSQPFKSRSTQELTKFYGLELKKDEGDEYAVTGRLVGSVQNENDGMGDWSAVLAFHPATGRLELVSSTNTDQVDEQLAQEIEEARVSADCLKSYGMALPQERLNDYLQLGLGAPTASRSFKVAMADARVQTLCYSKPDKLVYFTELAYYFTELESQDKPGPMVALRLPKTAEKGTTYRFGYWDTKSDKVKFSPYFSAEGMGDAAIIEKVQLAKRGTVSISGETGGGDGPCGWHSKVVYDAARNSIKAENYSEYCDTQEQETQTSNP